MGGRIVTVVLLVMMAGSNSYAEYAAIGTIQGNHCSGLFIKTCGLKDIAAVSGSDGKLHEIKTTYDSVTEYKETTGKCFIRVSRSSGLGPISWAINYWKGTEFYAKDSSGEFTSVDIEYITFKCKKQ